MKIDDKLTDYLESKALLKKIDMDTSTVRLVIFVSMFLVFAGDYSSLIASIFGNATEKNITDATREPKAQLKGPHEKTPVVSKTDVDKNNGKNEKDI